MIRILAIALAATLAASTQEGGRKRPEQGEGIEAGKKAANFKLKKLKAKEDEKPESVELASFAGKKPVLLIFGSYT
ncbi:MAG TPA: hypothetical protein VGK61_08095 [Planctomycetota bacterium]|jgi:hypothetical protein